MSDGDRSGAVYMANLGLVSERTGSDVRFPAPPDGRHPDRAPLEGELASQLLAALRSRISELAAEIALTGDLPTEEVQSGLNTCASHSNWQGDKPKRYYEMIGCGFRQGMTLR